MKRKLFKIIVSSLFISILLLGCINIYKSHNTVNAAVASNKYITSMAKKRTYRQVFRVKELF